MDFTPATFKFGNPLEDTSNALNTVLMMEKATDLRAKRRRGEARNSLMQTPGVMKDDGTIDRPTLRTAAVKGGYGEFIPDWEEQWAKDDENVANVGKIKADTLKSAADASKTQADDIAKRLETTSKMLGLIQSPQQYVEFVTKDPVLGQSLTERGMGAEQLMMALGKMSPEQFQRFLVDQRVGADKALQNHYVTANKGGTGGIYQMPAYGAGAPKEVANWKVTENPNSFSKHWVQDVIPGTNQVVNRVVKPGQITNTKPVGPSAEDKALTKAIADKTKAAAALVPELNKMGGGRFVVHPETGDIEIIGGQPMSPVAQRRLDLLAGEYGAQIEMVPGQNPRIVLNDGTTLGTVQSIQRAKNSLVWERGPNGVERLTNRTEGVERRPIEPKEKSAVDIRTQAISKALAWAKATYETDDGKIQAKIDEFYQDLISRPGAGYGGPSLREQLKADGLL